MRRGPLCLCCGSRNGGSRSKRSAPGTRVAKSRGISQRYDALPAGGTEAACIRIVGSCNRVVGSWNRRVGSWNRGGGWWNRGVGSWNRRVGSWNRRVGSWNRGGGWWNRGVGSWNRGVGSWNRRVESWNRGVESWNRGVGSWNRGVGSWNRGVGSWNRGVGSWNRRVGSWNRRVTRFNCNERKDLRPSLCSGPLYGAFLLAFRSAETGFSNPPSRNVAPRGRVRHVTGRHATAPLMHRCWTWWDRCCCQSRPDSQPGDCPTTATRHAGGISTNEHRSAIIRPTAPLRCRCRFNRAFEINVRLITCLQPIEA